MEKQIKWDDKFEERSDSDKIAYLKKLSSSLNNALDLMQQERNELRDKVTVHKAMLDNAQQAIDQQRNINVLSITGDNERKEADANTIMELRDKLKTMGALDGSHD